MAKRLIYAPAVQLALRGSTPTGFAGATDVRHDWTQKTN